ncbi:MAG: class I SAM-dependent methyltransferase [Candidatus Dormibacteraeota bacterium]|nr:class I SAM-dependent methyltransferase [Candidatus Dormibacteraeota bacterium]
MGGQRRPPLRGGPGSASWVLPVIAGAGGLATAIALGVRRRRLERVNEQTSRHLLRSPFCVSTIPDELRRIGVAPGLVVLDVGCGPGTFLEEAARTAGRGGEARGVEPDAEWAEVARSRLRSQGLGRVAVDVAPTHRLPYGDGAFDLAYLVAMLGRVRDREGTLREVLRVLKPGGRLAVTEHLADSHYVPASLVRRFCLAAGFEMAESGLGRWDHTSAFRKPVPAAVAATA